MNITIVLLIFSLAIKGLYIPLNRRRSQFYWKIPLDNKIPLLPFFTIFYLLYHPGVFSTYILLWNTPHINRFLLSIIISYIISTIFWYFIPNGVSRPILTQSTILHNILRFIYKHDGDTNGFPSAHVFVSLICGHFLSTAFPAGAIMIWPSILLIILSTVFTKQHYMIDILGGMLVYIVTLYAFTVLM